MGRYRWLAWLCGALLGSACDDSGARERAQRGASAEAAAKRPPAAPTPTSRLPAVERVVAIGDIHGDVAAARSALRLAGLISQEGAWIGGSTVLVQTGDVLDRGGDEQAILDWFERLEAEAAAAGGAVYMLNGNHELMNVALDFRYVTPAGFSDFEDAPGVGLRDPRLQSLPVKWRARASVFLPGGSYARRLAEQPVVLVIGDTVYCHGGVLPRYADDIERMNRAVASWLVGLDDAGRSILEAEDGPVWSRHYGGDPSPADCELLNQALAKLGAERMVVGHTVQPAISAACAGKVWRIDVGMAAHYGGKPAALELGPGTVRVLH
jgi:hypothetical protein